MRPRLAHWDGVTGPQGDLADAGSIASVFNLTRCGQIHLWAEIPILGSTGALAAVRACESPKRLTHRRPGRGVANSGLGKRTALDLESPDSASCDFIESARDRERGCARL